MNHIDHLFFVMTVRRMIDLLEKIRDKSTIEPVEYEVLVALLEDLKDIQDGEY